MWKWRVSKRYLFRILRVRLWNVLEMHLSSAISWRGEPWLREGTLQRVESKCLISLSRWGQRTTKVKRLSLLEGWHISKQEATLKFAGQIKALLTCDWKAILSQDKKRFYTMLNSLPFWSKQTARRWRSLCSCVLWSFLSFKTTWSDLFPALCKVPWFFAIGWQMGKTGFYLSVIFPQAFSYKQTLLAMWISYFSQDAEQLALFTFYVFTDLDKVSVHKHTKILSPSKQAWSLT